MEHPGSFIDTEAEWAEEKPHLIIHVARHEYRACHAFAVVFLQGWHARAWRECNDAVVRSACLVSAVMFVCMLVSTHACSVVRNIEVHNKLDQRPAGMGGSGAGDTLSCFGVGAMFGSRQAGQDGEVSERTENGFVFVEP